MLANYGNSRMERSHFEYDFVKKSQKITIGLGAMKLTVSEPTFFLMKFNPAMTDEYTSYYCQIRRGLLRVTGYD